MTPLKLALWAALALAQLGVPAWMIIGQERVLREGRQLRLQTRPVDPADLFRGRYVALAFALEQVPRERAEDRLFEPGESAYLELREGADGYAEAAALTKEKPAGELTLPVEVTFVSPPTIGVTLPFNRYYMDENAAPAAEAAYRDRAADLETWVTVRLLDGRAVIEELYIGGKAVREFLRGQAP